MSANATDALLESQTGAADLEEMMQRGISAAQAGNKTAAYNTFQQIVSQHPNIAEVWVWLGGTSPSLDVAEAAFNRATELDPNNEEAKLGLRWVALRRQAPSTSGSAANTGPLGNTDRLATGNLGQPTGAATSAITTRSRRLFSGLFSRGSTPVPVLMLVGLVLILYIAVIIYFLTTVH